MKHTTSTTANGLCTPPCGSSHGNLSSLRFRNSLLMPLLVLFLLVVGSSAVWAWNVRGEGLPGLNTCTDCPNWDSNIVEMAGIGNNTYCATFLNVAAESGTRYRFKICDYWKGTDNLDQSKSNVNFVDAGDKRISFTLPYESNVYVFYNSSTDKIWVIAIPVSVSNYNGSSDIRQDLGLDKDGWLNKDKGGVRFTSSSAYAKRVAAFVIPKGMQWRYEIYTGDTKKVSKTTVPKSDDNTRLALVVWDGSSNTANVTMMPYVQKKSGWKLFVDDVEQGTVNSNGDYTVNNLSATSHTFYFTNGESTTYNGINYFGGCYVNTSVSSSLFSNHQYYKTDAVGTFLVPTIDDKGNGSNSNYYMLPKGKFTLSGGAKDVTFNFDGGVITINAVDHGAAPDPEPEATCTTFPVGETLYLRCGNEGGSYWDWQDANHFYATFMDNNNTPLWSDCMTSTGEAHVHSIEISNAAEGATKVKIELRSPGCADPWGSDCTMSIDGTNDCVYKPEYNATAVWETHGDGLSCGGGGEEPAEPSLQPWSGDSYRDWYLTGDFTNPGAFDGWTQNPDGYKFAADGDNYQTASVILDPNDATRFHEVNGHKLTRFEIIRQGTWNDPRINKPQFDAGSSNCSLQTDWVNGNSNRMTLELTSKSTITFRIWRWGTAPGSADRKVTVTITPVPQVTVTYKVNNDTYAQQTIDQGGKATNPGTPSDPAGYRFAGWDWDFNSAVNSSITVDAVLTEKTLESISLNESSIVMVMGGSNATLTPSFLPADLIAEKRPTYDWSVSEGGVVTVDGGVITAVGEGTVTVTCTAHGTDKSATCVVKVKDCNTVPTNIFTYIAEGNTATGGTVATPTFFSNSVDNEGIDATLRKVYIKLAGNQNHYATYNGDYVTSTNQQSGASEWILIPTGGTNDDDDPLYYIRLYENSSLGKYVHIGSNTQTGDWAVYETKLSSSIDTNNETKYQWYEGSCGDNPRVVSMFNGHHKHIIQKGDLFLHNHNQNHNWGLPSPRVATGAAPDCQDGNQFVISSLQNNGTISNPAYLSEATDGYYRAAKAGTLISATMNRPLKVGDKIILAIKNDQAVSGTATVVIGEQVENIDLVAGTTNDKYEIEVTEASRPTTFTISSNSTAFMLKSVVVNREIPGENQGKNPNLKWSDTPSVAHQVAAGDISSYTATRSGTGLITYTSSDESIATVNATTGEVHPVAEGTVTITATLEQDGCYDGGSINYSLTLVDLPKPTITLTVPDEAVPQGSVQTISASREGDGTLTVSIASGTDATLTDNGNGNYTLRLGANATDIVIEAATTRTETYAQHAIQETVSVSQCAPDGRVIYEYELTGHADVADVAATGGTYSQANLASVGTTDNPATVTKIKLKFSKGNGNRIYAVDNGGNLRVQDEGNVDIAEWLLIPAGETVSNPFGTNASYPVYYVCNAKTGRYIYYGSTTSGSGDWVYTIAQLSSTNHKTNYYKWFIEVNNGETRIFSVQNRTIERKSSFKLNSANQYNSGYGSDVKDDHSLLCVGKMSDTNEYSRIYTDNGEMNVGSAANPDYFYSVTHGAHEYYILYGGTVTVSRASAFKVGDVITLNVFNRGDAAGNTIKVANNTIVTNVNGAAALTYTVVAEDGIEGLNSFVITPLNGYICLNSISIFRPKDESEFINPTLTWVDADLSEQQIINMNNSETGMSHAVSVNAPVNEAVVYSVSPAAKADINSATGALTLTNEAQNKDVLTVTATLPAIGCYNEAHATYEIYVMNLATPTLSAAFGTLQQGFASTLTVTTNSDAVPALSNISGFAVNGDPTHEGDNYIYNIVVNNTVESVSVHVAIAQTSDYLADATNADGAVTTSSLEELYENTPEGGTLVLEADYNENIVIDKPITIDGNNHAIGNLKVENEGDLTLSSALTVNDFTICAKAGNTEIHAASGQVRNASNLTVNGEAYFLYTVDPSGKVHYGWYDFTVPFRVNVMTGIKGIQNEVLKEDFVNERDYAIMEHLGEKQAAGEYAYKKFRGVMEPCRLYSITLDDDYNYNTIRFQKADGAIAADNGVTLNAYASIVDDKHANWNGVGNGTLHHADAGLSVDYVQVYQSGNKTFLPVDRNNYSFVIGSAFMVQQAGSMTLAQATHNELLLAPARQASNQPSAISIQIAREDKPFSDQLFITANEDAEPVYTPGVDVAKAGNIGNVNVPQIWTNAYNSKLCAHEAQLINGKAHYELSLYAPADGSYKLTSKNIPEGYTLYLTQNGRAIWNLSINDTYSLDLTKGTHSEYGLMIVKLNNAPTEIDAISSQPSGSGKVIRNGILYILRNGKVFNAQGAVMK